MINNFMSLYSSNLNPLSPGEYTQPYKHATKLFVADTFRLAPKQSFLYYVVFEVDPSQTELGSGLLNGALEFANRYERLENGLLVKDIDLPKFSIGTKTLNAYNRKNIIQTNISYDPISVTFHDDSANVITNFWNDYYTYYFRDSDYTTASYGVQDKYNRRRLSGWGYSPRNGATNTLLKSIRIFSLHNKKFTEYYLVNPIINSWRHGRHEAASNTGIMENIMNVSYEAVKYFTGFVNPVNVDGFSLLHYDNKTSPIAGDFLGDIDAVGALKLIDGAPKDLRKPDGTQGAGGPLSSLLTVFRTYQNLKNVNIRTAAAATLAGVGTSVLNDVLNGRVSFPTDSTNTSRVGINSAVATKYPYANGGFSDDVTDAAGVAISAVTGAAINTGVNTLTQLASNTSRGIRTSLNGAAVPSGAWSRVYDVVGTSGGVAINPSSMQPSTGTYTAYITDDVGNTISEVTVAGTLTGSYNPNNQSENLVRSQLTKDENGNNVIVASYQDGTQVVFDEATNDTLYILPGTNTDQIIGLPEISDAATTSTRQNIINGTSINPNSPQFVTDAVTGVSRAVGGIVTGTIVDLGGAAGAVLGSRLGGTGGAVVGGLIGRSLASSLATTTGNQIGRAISGGITPIIDRITGDIRQGIDNFTGSIKNVVGSWTGTGGFNPAAPYDNLVSTVYGSDGSVTEIFKNGDRLVTAGGSVELIKGSDTLGTGSFWNNPFGKNIDTSGASVGAGYGTIWTDGSGNPILSGDNQYIFSGGDVSYLGSVNYGLDQADYLGGFDGTPGGIYGSSVEEYGALIDSEAFGAYTSGLDSFGSDFDVDFNFGDWSW